MQLILVSFPTNRLAVLTAQLNERRAPLFRPNSGQAAGPHQGNRPHTTSFFFSFCLLILHRCQKMRLDVLFLRKEKVIVEVCVVTLKGRKEDLVCPGLTSVSTTLTWINAWSDCNRWFIRSLSCEWGCTIPSTNDRGSQAPSICPCGAKNWSVWWVPLGFLHLRADATSSLVLFPFFFPTLVHSFILFTPLTFLSSFSYLSFMSCILLVPRFNSRFASLHFFSSFRCLRMVLEHDSSMIITLSLFCRLWEL